MGAFATGVAIVTTEHNGELYGMTVNSLTSVSLDPCLLLICIRHGSKTGSAIASRGAFLVNLLSVEQSELASRFATASGGRFDEVKPGFRDGGLPHIPGSLAFLTCQVEQTILSGDHEIVIGRVLDCECAEREPLLFFRGRFGLRQVPTAA